MRITAEFIAELAHFNAGIRRARLAYNCPPDTSPCIKGACDDGHLCSRCRSRVKADLRVATSVDECAELLARLDLPSPTRRRKVVKPCGTPAAYVRHIRHGEKACEPCLLAFRADKSERNRAANREAVRRYRAAKKAGGAA